MKLVVGLGNPGDRYVSTRHNVGFRVVEALARASGIDVFEERFAARYGCRPRGASQVVPELGVLLPHTFMNRSGESVAEALRELPIGDLGSHFAVVIDDLDLPFGRLRIRPSGGAGGHRGLESLIDHLHTDAFPRLRFGIGRPSPDQDPVQHVLAPFSDTEEQQLGGRIDVAVEALETLLRDGVPAAMDRFNGPVEANPSAEPTRGPLEV